MHVSGTASVLSKWCRARHNWEQRRNATLQHTYNTKRTHDERLKHQPTIKTQTPKGNTPGRNNAKDEALKLESGTV